MPAWRPRLGLIRTREEASGMASTVRFVWQVLRLIARSQWPTEKLRAFREQRLRRLLAHAAKHSPFYGSRLRGIDPRQARLQDVTPLTKPEMMENFDAVVTDRRISLAGVERFMQDPANHGKPFLGQYAVCHSSGSQGQPVVVVQGADHMLLAFAVQAARQVRYRESPLALALRRWHEPSRLALVTQRPGFYPSSAVFSCLQEINLPFVRLLRLSVFDPPHEVVARLNDFRPNFLAGYSSSLEMLAHEERVGRLRLRQTRCLEQITNVSEPLPATSRKRIEGAFGVHVADQYALAECPALTFGCPMSVGSHLNADLAYLEVADDDYRPVPDGTPGTKVLVTNLYNLVQPLIRYEVGDVVTLSERRCVCGSTMPHIESVAGRTKERLWVEADGEAREVPYYLFLAALHQFTDIAEHQVLQTGRNQFIVRVAPQPGRQLSGQRVLEGIARGLDDEGMAGKVEVDVEVVPEIPPDPRTGKRQRVRNLVGPPAGVQPARPEPTVH